MSRRELELALRKLAYTGEKDPWIVDEAVEETIRGIERLIEEKVQEAKEEILTTIIPAGYSITPAGWR